MIGKQIRTYSANESIFGEGETGDWAYLIESGRVLVYLKKDGGEVPLKVLGNGEIFGEMSLIDNSLRSASCRAITEVRVAVVTQEQLLDRIKSADPIVRLLMRALLDRLREQNNSIRGKSIEPSQVNSTVLEREKQEALDRISLENRISMALENDEFIPHYQPIFDLETLEIRGCEALLRWQSPDGKIRPPGEFIDVLEQSSLIIGVGQKMIEKCIHDLSELRSNFGIAHDFFVSVNISGRQFADPNFVSNLDSVRAAAGLPAHHLKLEVTERIMTEGPQAIATLEECRALGYLIAIDDFGTGFSSLQYLASMPLNDLKVDRGFVNRMISQRKSLSVVKTLIYLARLLKLNLVAEGIETKEQLERLKMLGVKMGQGYYFSKALPYSDFVAMVTGKSAKKAA